jgi:isocitrate dehydrogenase
MYWANELASQTEDTTLKATFEKVRADMKAQENDIISELNNAQGAAEDVKGYYLPDTITTFAAMRPSATLNAIIDNI